MKITNFKFNPNHIPAGSPEGGEFAPSDGGGSSGPTGNDHRSQKIHGSGSDANKAIVREALNSLPKDHWDRAGDLTVAVVQKIGGNVLGRTSYDPVTSKVDMLKIAETYKAGDQTKKNKNIGGVALHEFGHALDRYTGWSSTLSEVLWADANKMNSSEEYLARYWLNSGKELFAEAYMLTYSKSKKGAFSMGQKRAEKVFAKSIEAIKALK